MKLFDVKFSFLIGCASWLIGVANMANASDLSNQPKWVNIKDSVHRMQVSFPRKPFELSLDLPFQNTPATGNVHIYSVPMEKENGLLVLSILTSPEVNHRNLEEERFKLNFEKYVVKYLFHQPHDFHKNQSFKGFKDEYEGLPILSFQFSYLDDQKAKLLKGVAVVQDNTIYHLFYVAQKNNYDDEILKEFVGSFHL